MTNLIANKPQYHFNAESICGRTYEQIRFYKQASTVVFTAKDSFIVFCKMRSTKDISKGYLLSAICCINLLLNLPEIPDLNIHRGLFWNQYTFKSPKNHCFLLWISNVLQCCKKIYLFTQEVMIGDTVLAIELEKKETLKVI